MKKLLIAFIAISFTPQLFAVNCECGSHASGITTYTVNGSGCCTSPIAGSSVGYIHSYAQNEGGTWSLTGSEQITGAQAQARCCPPG